MGVRQWVLFGVASFLLVALAAIVASQWAGAAALNRLAQEARAESALHAALLKTELEKYRSLPYVLARDPDVVETLRTGEPGARAELSRKLALLAKETNAYLLFIQDAFGVIVSSSNYLRPNSFINCQCAGGHYFQDSLQTPSIQYFAKGRTAGRSGLYITHAVKEGARPIGVASVKTEFDWLEKQWRRQNTTAFVTDADGVIIITSVPEWKYRPVAPLTSTSRAEIAASGRFEHEALVPLAVRGLSTIAGTEPIALKLPAERTAQSRLVSRAAVGESGWTLHLMKPSATSVAAAKANGGLTALLAGFLVAGTAGVFLRRGDRRRQETLRELAAREELEHRVEDRTRELTEANRRLVSEMHERRRIQANLQRLQDDLVQANKLATLGQIAAGVAHEINQPVAAIKTYAENASVLLERGQQDLASQNLGVIGQLTGRISAITDQLRAFARRSAGKAAPMRVGEAIDGALLLMSHKLTQAGVSLTLSGARSDVLVHAERGKLEQVLLNLLQNALDALRSQANGAIELAVDDEEDTVRITVSDNGPGLSPEVLASLFMPFATTKPDGLGLGLIISRDIACAFGGDLTALSSEAGASFTVTLRRAA